MPNYEENAKIVKVQYEERRSLQPLGAIFQYDTGHYLELVDFPNLPDYFEVQFGLDQYGKTTPQVGHECAVKIPDELVRKGTEIYAWLWVVSENLGLTKCQIIIPVIPRGEIPCSCPTSEQESAIDQAIIALNDELARLEAAAQAAEEARKAVEAIPDPKNANVGDYLRIGYEGNPQWKEGGGSGSIDVDVVDECLILGR